METTNQKSIIDTHTKKERTPNITLKIVIKSQGTRTKEEERNKKELKKKINKMTINTYVSVITLERVAWTYIHYRM